MQKSKFQIFLNNWIKKEIVWKIIFEKDNFLKIKEENGAIHRFYLYNNIIENSVDIFDDLDKKTWFLSKK